MRAVKRIVILAVTIGLIGWGNPFTDASSWASQLPSSTPVNDDLDGQTESGLPWPHATSDLKPDPAITFGRLANGFRFVLMQNQRPEDRVSLHLYIRAGSLNEACTQQGVAHFLEHMLFNGSTHFPPGELVRYFQSIGMQFGNDANAHTGFDETVYDIVLPKGDAENLRKGLLVMHDYAMGASLLEAEVKRESGVILAEKRTRDSAAFRTFKATLKFELPDFLVSRRLPIGKANVIRDANRPLLKDFYDAWYRPDNMVLVVVGDFPVPLTSGIIEKQFEGFSPRAPVPALPDLGRIDHRGLKIFHHHEPESGGTTISIEVVRDHLPAPDSSVLRRREVVEEVADRIIQNRLDARLKAPNAPYTSAAVGSGVYLNRVRYAEITADSTAENWQHSLTVLEQALRRARLHGFSDAELVRVKKNMLKMLANAVKEAPTRNSTTLARGIIRQLAHERVILSPEQTRAVLGPVLESVTLEEVEQAFAENWPDDHRLVLVTGDADLETASSVEPVETIRNVYLASASTVVKPPEAKTVAVFPYLPAPEGSGTIAARETIEDLGITRIRLGNGIQINLKRTDFKTNEVLANLTFGRGRSSAPENLPGIALLAEATIGESGLGSMDTNDLERALAGKSTYVDFRTAETHFNLFGETVSTEVDLLFQLLYAHIIDPGWRDDALDLARDRLRQEYQSASRSIEGMMRLEGLRLLAGGDNRFGMPAFEKIQAIELNDIRDWIGPPLNHAPLELSIVGDFDEARVIQLAQRYLGTLPNRDLRLPSPRDDLPSLPVGTVHRIDVDTQIPKAMVVAAWQTEDFWEIGRTRRLSVLADVFSERLRQRIREKLGVSYSPYAFNRASRAYKGYGVFQAYVNVAPDQVDIVLSEVEAIAGDLAHNGITADELARAIDPILTSIKALRQTNGYWLNSVMTGSQRYPEQIEWARSFVKDYAAVTTQELAGLSATYLTQARSAAIIIQPASKQP